MPGLFGAIGTPPACWETLCAEFSAIWGEIEFRGSIDGSVGGHSFGPEGAVHALPDGTVFAVDGEAHAYRRARGFADGSGEAVYSTGLVGLLPASTLGGNLVLRDPTSGFWYLAGTPSGSFPLYYTQAASGLLFSSLLRPLVKGARRVARMEPDMVGVTQWLRRGNHLYGDRTLIQSVHRLLPGQVLCYEPRAARLTVLETSDICAGGYDPRTWSLEGIADLCWHNLIAAVERSAQDGGSVALMMSGGWDSRVLFAALREVMGVERMLCWSHGDLRSRESGLVRALCRESGARVRLESNEQAYDSARFDTAFERVESLVFPEWLHAGQALAQMGLGCATAGVYGEVLGGDQGPDDLVNGLKKIPVLARAMLSARARARERRPVDPSVLREIFAVEPLARPWYMEPGAWEALTGVHDAINADLDGDLHRLLARGIEHQDQLLEAFGVESRQSQFTIAQLLSCRVAVDVSVPFGDWELLRLASRIPWAAKYHRSLMRRMLERHARDLLEYPVAAALVPAKTWIAAQEASRLVRRTEERWRWRLHHASRGIVPYPRYGWWWYEFLADGRLIRSLVDDLRADFWDRAAIRQRVEARVGDHSGLDFRSPTADTLGSILRISTVDRLLR
jgi:asparagine synthetase B (glutamine-hydrolysing)